MDFAKSKKLKVIGASALAFVLTLATSFFLLTTDVDANARNKKTQTTLMAKQKAPEEPEESQTKTQKKNKAKEETSPTETVQKPEPQQAPPKSLDERLAEDLQRARVACEQNKDVEAFRTASSVANTIKRNKLDQTGADAEKFKEYYQEAVEVAQTSGDRLQKKSNNHAKPLVFIF